MFDVMTITVADLEHARQEHVGARLHELQSAVRQAEQAMEAAPANVATAEQAATDAMQEHDKQVASVRKKLIAAGLGVRADIAAGNDVAAGREFAFRISQAAPVREAALKVKQARSSLNTLRGGIEATREAHNAACAALKRFCERQIEGN